MIATKNIEVIAARALLAVAFIVMCFGVFPHFSEASTRYTGEVAGWIPWWSDTAGLVTATKNIKKLDTVYPFAYEVGGIDASITDKANLQDKQWQDFFTLAKKNHVEIIPSIAWIDPVQIDYMLSDPARRAAHIQAIVDIVNKGGYAGINIDYENKDTKTIDNFSLFLKELKAKLRTKLLTCALEARTPAKDLYVTVPAALTYANDYKSIAKYCDRVELMTYDQQLADLTLNAAHSNTPYAPVADNAWVEKVVKLALADIPASKVLLGIATYGRAWDITVTPTGYKNTSQVSSLNATRVEELSKTVYKTPIGHNDGGEAIMTYFPDDSIYKILTSLPTPKGTPVGLENAAKASLFAKLANMNVKVRFITYSDAAAAASKMTLAKKYSLRGVTFFKIDGEEDQGIWNLM
jgi:spore germination protein YaaH